MNNKKITVAIAGVRMMNVEQGCAYTGLGNNSFRVWAEKIGSKRKFGARALYDRKVIDEALDKLNGSEDAMEAAAAQ